MKINRGIVSQKSKERIAMKSKKQTLLAVSSMMGFIVLWATVTDAWNYSAFLFPRHPPVNRFLYGYLSRILWMFPAFILIRRFDKCLYRSGKQMFSKPKAEPVFIVFTVLTTGYVLVSMMIDREPRHITWDGFLLSTVKFIIVGIGEETVFRGWGYNLLKKVNSEPVSLLVSAFLFAALHLPAYFIKLILYGQFDLPGMMAQSMSALLLGMLFAVMFRRSGTLWNPILAHFYYDLMLEVFT